MAYNRDEAETFGLDKAIQAGFDEIYSTFGLEYSIVLSTRPENKYIGKIETWNIAEKALADACTSVGREFKINVDANETPIDTRDWALNTCHLL